MLLLALATPIVVITPSRKVTPMSEAREFTAHVVLREPTTLEVVAFAPGDEVPDWAIGQVGEHVSQGVTRPVQTAEVGVPTITTVVDDGEVTESITPAHEVVEDDEADEVEEDDDEAEEEVEPYDQWTKADLKAEAKGRELSGYSSASKEELVELLEQDDAEHLTESE
jgi:hypothetical protein